MTSASASSETEQAAGSKLPYLAQIDDHTILLRDQRLMQVLHLDGLLFETADSKRPVNVFSIEAG
jgi:type IV secretion system protein VirB4